MANQAKGSKDPTEYDLEVRDYDKAKEAVKKGVQFELSAQKKPAIFKVGEQLRLLVS